MAYAIEEDEDGCVTLRCPNTEDELLYPEEVASHIIRQLLDDVVRHTGGGVIRKAVISVPAYFNDIQREETVTAGLVAGLDTVRLVRYAVSQWRALSPNAVTDAVNTLS